MGLVGDGGGKRGKPFCAIIMSKRQIHQMTTQEIVRNSDEFKNKGKQWEQIYVTLYNSLASDKYRIMRQNNTLFWYRLDAPKTAQLFIINADKPLQFLRNFKDFCKAMEVAGFRQVYGVTENPKMLEMLKHSGYPTTVEQLPNLPDGTPQYKGTVNV